MKLDQRLNRPEQASHEIVQNSFPNAIANVNMFLRGIDQPELKMLDPRFAMCCRTLRKA